MASKSSMNGISPVCLFIALLTVLLSISPAVASPHDHRYDVGEIVPLFVNKVGPLNNPSETYHYYDLPFCHPDEVVPNKGNLGGILNGDRLANALYELRFREEKIGSTLCENLLKAEDIIKFKNAIRRDFYFQMYYDDLPFWGFIGKIEDVSWSTEEKTSKYYIFKHIHFDVLYSGNRIIEIQAFSDPEHAIDITETEEINIGFTYSVSWNSTAIDFGNRMDKYSRASLLPVPRQIHWFSFINSVVIVALLIGLLVILFMSHLKNDLRKYSGGGEEDEKEVGWKYIHSDVYRFPRFFALLCAVLGNGTQLLIIICFLFILAFIGTLYPYNGSALSNCLLATYILTSPVAGYSAMSLYGQFAETGWERCLLVTGILYVGPLVSIVLILNTVAVSYGSTAALPFGTFAVIFLVYALFAIPLLVIGGLVGYRFRSRFRAPSAGKKWPREIPSLSWYRTAPGQMFIGGLLPSCAIILELHQLYASMWGYKILTLPSILFVTFVILLLLTSLASIHLTYVQLAAEDHEWWWRSVLRGGSTAIFMLLYGIYFYAKSNMSGLMQLAFFFGYNACFCYALFLVLGSVGFRASQMFIRHVYDAVKGE